MSHLTQETATEATEDVAETLVILAAQPFCFNYAILYLEALLVILISQSELSLSASSSSKTRSGRASRARGPSPSDRVLRPRVHNRAASKVCLSRNPVIMAT